MELPWRSNSPAASRGLKSGAGVARTGASEVGVDLEHGAELPRGLAGARMQRGDGFTAAQSLAWRGLARRGRAARRRRIGFLGGCGLAFKAGRSGIAGAVGEGTPRWSRRGSRRAERSRCARLKESLEGGASGSARAGSGERGVRSAGVLERADSGSGG